jgi:acyl-CoA reductase-like NAD-dependent aldehyde dehydrogenase
MTRKLFINGEFVDPVQGKTLKNVNPATEEALEEVAIATQEDVDKAVESAKTAQKEWRQRDPSDRSAVLMKVAACVESRAEELVNVESEDSGRPKGDCHEDIHAVCGMFRYFSGMADKITGEVLPVQNDKLCYTSREPYGVIGAITAWNYPMFNASAKIAPILATGNSCILKPAEEASLSPLLLGSIISGIEEFPPGLLSVLTGTGDITGAAMANHSSIDKISFTGSTEVGREILHSSASSNLKSVVLELGGKSPVIIFDDANLDAAINAIIFSVFYNQGQTCTAGTRLYVQKSIRQEVIDRLVDRAKSIKVGDPAQDDDIAIGPLISREQLDKVESFVSEAKKVGMEPLCGGKRPEGYSKGYFFLPTIYENVPTNSRLVQEEIFGPVLVVSSFENEEKAIELANATEYGLAASVWSISASRILRVSGQVDSGVIWCNTLFAEHPGAPVGGFKQSGFGREFGKSAIEEYTRQKTVWIDSSDEFFVWP